MVKEEILVKKEVIIAPITAYTLDAIKHGLERRSVYHFRTCDGRNIDFVREKLEPSYNGGWSDES